MTAGEIAHALGGRKSGAGYVAKCPAHDDQNPSLSLRDADGKVLAHCHAGCSQDTVINTLRNLGLWEQEQRADRQIVAEYNYCDASGALLYQVIRFQPKSFAQRYPNSAGGWVWKKHPQQVLYRLPEVIEAPIVFLTEGEKDAETLRAFGFVATCEAGGANAKWLPQFTEALRGREVILLPDRDQPGYARVKRIARELLGNVARLIYLELEDGKDVSEWFDRGHSEVELIALLNPEGITQ